MILSSGKLCVHWTQVSDALGSLYDWAWFGIKFTLPRWDLPKKKSACRLIPGIWSAKLQTLILYLMAGILSKAGRALGIITLTGNMSTAPSLRLDARNLYWFLIQDYFWYSSVYNELLYAGPPSLFIYWVALIHGVNNLFHIYNQLITRFLTPSCVSECHH